MTVKIGADGWLEIPHSGNATDQAFVGFGTRQPDEWQPAFKRTDARGRRVLAVPPPAWRGNVVVWVRVNGVERREGTVRL